MARNTLEAWLPEEFDSNVIMRVQQTSAIDQVARKIPMGSNLKSVPRTAGMSVEIIPKGGAYGEDVSVNDQVLLTVYKFGKVVRIAEEDIDDSLADFLSVKKTDWATSYARMLDNACLATSVVANGTTVPFNSVYYSLATTDAATGYTANANIVKTLTTVAVTYKNFSDALGLVEGGDFFDEANIVVIAHPAIKAALRGILDTQGHPIFVEDARQGSPSTLFGYPIKWANGARKSSVATSTPTGNQLIFFVNTDFLLLGVRSGPESVLIDGKGGASALTDESLLKLRARRAFALANQFAASILEIVP